MVETLILAGIIIGIRALYLRATKGKAGMKNLVLGFILLAALAGCTAQGPLAPDRDPLSPDQARTKLEERSIPYSQRAFFEAAAEGDLETVRLFIEAGMDVNVQTIDEDFDTALMHSAGGGHLKVVRYLVDQGADIYRTNARCAGSFVMEITVKDPLCNRQDALMWAAHNGRIKVVEYFISKKDYIPDIDWFDPRYGPNSAIMLAAYSGHLNILKFLRDHVHFNYKDYLGSRDAHALLWASEQGHLDIVKFLFDQGTNINPGVRLDGTRGSATTPLMMASYGGQVDVVVFLLGKGADIHVRESMQYVTDDGSVWTEFGASALTAAIDQGHDEIMALLLEHWMHTYGADGRDDHGRTSLMYAASWGNIEWMQRLVDNGAPVNTWTYVGTTALMFAAAAGHVEAVKLLLDLGEDPSIENSHGHTALSLAEGRGHEDVASLLRNVEEEQLNS